PEDDQQPDAKVSERQDGQEDEHASEHRQALEDHLDRLRTGPLAERDGERAVLPILRPAFLSVHEYAPRNRNAGQLDPYFTALGDESALAFTYADGDSVFGRFAGDRWPGGLTSRVAEAVSSIRVEHRLPVTRGGVEEQRKGVGGPLARV